MKYLVLVFFCLSILFVAFVPNQEDFLMILVSFTFAFISYIKIIKSSQLSFKTLLFISIGIRVILIFAFPNLSDDIYRFIWDGNLIHEGISPYSSTPTALLPSLNNMQLESIYPLLNSPDYFSIYPPFSQFIFYLASFSIITSTFQSAIIIKLLLLISEVITIVFGIKLLTLLQLPKQNILWYALNPLIVIEIMGNVHFEGFMVCFFVLALYYLKKSKLNLAALFIALSIAAKLIPLLFLPYFLFKWKFKKTFFFYIKIGILLFIIFLPVLIQLTSFGNSFDLYFRKFEFNASIYYILRFLGQLLYGYNTIGILGPALAITVFLGVFYFALVSGRKFTDFTQFALLSISLYLMLGTTVHPWYLSLGILLSIFSNSRFMIYWSLLIVLSYSKYLWIDAMYYLMISLEYIALAVVIYWEMKNSKQQQLRTLAKSD